MGMPMMVLLLFHTDLICRFGDNDLIFMFTFRRTDNRAWIDFESIYIVASYL